MIGWLLMALGSAWAGCPEDPAAEVDGAVTAADEAFVALMLDEVKVAAARAEDLVPCLPSTVTPERAGALHRLRGLRMLLDSDRGEAVRAFAAARAADPAFAFSPSIAPPGSPVMDAWTDTAADRPDLIPYEPPKGGTWHFDGTPQASRPAEWPVVAQLVDEDGAVLVGDYVLFGEELPEYALREGFLGPRGHRTAPGALLAATAVTAVAGGVLYGLAAQSEAQYNDPGTPDAELPTVRRRTNSLAVASATTGAVALGLGVTFVAVRF